MIEDIGPFTAADEGLNHQIADTFATVRESDRGWTEKIWAATAISPSAARPGRA